MGIDRFHGRNGNSGNPAIDQLNVKVSRFRGNINALVEKNNDLYLQNLKFKEENSHLKDKHFQITRIRNILELNMLPESIYLIPFLLLKRSLIL
jgi:hypothetical protein